jgi:hypothetical protein
VKNFWKPFCYASQITHVTKYWSRELLKLSFCHVLRIFQPIKKDEARNITSSFTFFIYLKSGFFPDSFCCIQFQHDRPPGTDGNGMGNALIKIGDALFYRNFALHPGLSSFAGQQGPSLDIFFHNP